MGGAPWRARRDGRAVAGAHMSSSHTGKALSHVEQVRKWVSPHSRQYASRLPPFARRTVATHRCTSHCRLGTCSAITLPRKSSSGGARGHCSQLRWAGVKIRLQKAHLMKEAISDPQRKGVKIRLQKAHRRQASAQTRGAAPRRGRSDRARRRAALRRARARAHLWKRSMAPW